MSNPSGKHRPKRRHPNEGTVVLRKDRWRARPWAAVVPYLDSTGRRRQTWLSAESKSEAEALRKAEVARRDRGIVPVEVSVAVYVSAWLETLDVGPGTVPRYRAHLSERIGPTFGDVALGRLTPAMVRTGVRAWSGAPATRAGALRLLRAAMKQAVLDRAIEHDPTAGIPYPRIVRKRPVTLTGEQARHLIETVAGERFAPILVVSIGLGLRRGEAIGLRTADVDLGAGTVTVSRSLRYIKRELRAPGEDPYRLTGTKTGDTRVLPLPAFVATALRARLAERDTEQRAAKVWAANDLVFCSPVGNSIPINTLYGWFQGALKRAGLPACRWHDLRGTTATLLIEQGESLETVRRVLGHRDISTTVRYIGETPDALEGAARRLGEAIG
jgi:integrase